jgi:eukaryotic-like serine/threonine-protein kinase
MDSTRYAQIETLFHETVERPDTERRAFLECACGDDKELMAEVLAMVDADRRKTSLLDRGLPDVAYNMIGTPLDLTASSEFGPYRLRKLLGEGGMGVVWLAERKDAGNLVAIKFLPHAGLSPARRDRFIGEIKTLAKLKHSYIARLYDAGTLSDGTPWFVMEYVEGVRFNEYCQSEPRSIEEQLRLFRKICEAVQYAHGQAIIHRDLKPSNILVEQDGTPRLLDFGIARELQNTEEPAEQTRAGLRFLSPDYAAPEWVHEGVIGLYTDVYSLGVIFYEMLAGHLPVVKAGGEAPQAPSPKQARSELDLICLKAMHRDPHERYQSAEALIRDIDHYLNREPLEARPHTLWYKANKFVVRNRRSVFAGSLVFTLIVLLSGFFTLRLAKERNAALAEAARTRRIQRFMLDLFGSGDKEAAPSNDLRVVTLLDRGVQSAAALKSDPETQGELYENLGRTYRLLGRYPKADELLWQALDKMRQSLGPADPLSIDALLQLGALRGDQARPAEAEKLTREGLDLATKHFPSNDPTVIGAKLAMGRVLAQSGSYEKAAALLEPLVNIPPSGEDGTNNLLEILGTLGYANHYLGHYDTAISLYRRTLALDRQVYGNAHPRVADDLANLGTAEATLGRLPEAESLYREAVGILKSWYGPDHPETVQLTSFVALILIQEGKLAEAEPLLRGVLQIQEKAYGPMHPIVGFTIDELGKLAIKGNNLRDAESYFTRANKIYGAVYGDTNPQTAMVKADLGDVFLKQARYTRAEQLYRQAVKVLTEKPLKGNVSVGVVEANLGRTLLRQGHYQEAQNYLTSGYGILIKKPQAYPEHLQEAREDLAAVNRALDQPHR